GVLLAVAGDVGLVQRVAAEDVVHALQHAVAVLGVAGEVEGDGHDHHVVEDQVVGSPDEHAAVGVVGQAPRAGLDAGEVVVGGGDQGVAHPVPVGEVVGHRGQLDPGQRRGPAPVEGAVAEHLLVVGVQRRGGHRGAVLLGPGGQEQFGRGPVELVGDVVVVVGAAALADGRRV